MKQCKKCGEAEQEKLHVQTYKTGKVVVFNLCKNCRKEICRNTLGRKSTPEQSLRQSMRQTGSKRTEQTKKRMSASMTGKHVGHFHSTDTKQRISETSRKVGVGKWMLGRKLSAEHRQAISSGLSNNKKLCVSARKRQIRYVEKQKLAGQPLMPQTGKNEKKLLDNYEINTKSKLVRQYRVVGYFLDGYDKENNIAVEVDEQHHFDENGTLCKKDVERQMEIQKYLNCDFVRIKDIGVELLCD